MKIIENKALYGVLEWILFQGGTVRKFNNHIIHGEIHGLSYRYFISEGWISLRTRTCPVGKGWESKSVGDFSYMVEHFVGKDKIIKHEAAISSEDKSTRERELEKALNLLIETQEAHEVTTKTKLKNNLATW